MCKTHQPGLWELWNYSNITTLQKHYKSQAKIHNIMEIKEQLWQTTIVSNSTYSLIDIDIK